MSIEQLMPASHVLLWILVIVQTLVLFELLRQVGILHLRIGPDPGALLVEGEGLQRGASAPTFEAPDLRTGLTVSQQSFKGQRVLLVFLTTRCQACRALVPDLKRVARNFADEVQLIAVCAGPGDECIPFADEYEFTVPILFDQHQEISSAYRVFRTPSATLLDGDGTVLIHGIPNDWRHLEGLIQEEGTPSAGGMVIVNPDEEGAVFKTG